VKGFVSVENIQGFIMSVIHGKTQGLEEVMYRYEVDNSDLYCKFD
jgi:hypothetical protein